MDLNSQLEMARKCALECQSRTGEVVSFLKTILSAFANDTYVQELFMSTGFGKSQQEKLDILSTKLEKIANALDTYVPTTVRTIEYQIELNNRQQGSANV